MKRARLVRPRATRLFVTRRRAVLLSMFLVGAAVPMGGLLVGLNAGQDPAAAIAAVLRDPLAMLEGRSPGARGAGAMFQTKPAKERVAAKVLDRGPSDRAPVGPKGPVERVLPVVRERPPEVPTGAPLGDFGPEPALAPLALPPEGATSTSSGGPPDFPPGITSTGGPPITSTSTSGGPPVNPPPVPEPATWMMMILGFGVVGSAIRRQNTIRRAAARG